METLTKENSPGMRQHPRAEIQMKSDKHSSVTTHDYTSDSIESQEKDVSKWCTNEYTELTHKFQPKKQTSLLLGESYGRIGLETKANRVSDCGSFLEFAHEIDLDGAVSDDGKLYRANFCRDRLCPMCAWRRSYKIFGQCSRIMQSLGDEYEYIFVTLTVPSVPGESLDETIGRMMKGWKKLHDRKRVKDSTFGFYRALEITRNSNKKSKSYGLYHPHFHCVFAVSKRYFKGENYITRDEWLALWQECYGDDTISQVDVRKARPKEKAGADEAVNSLFKLASAVAEIAKYAAKSSDYLFAGMEKETDEVVKTLSGALDQRRLVAFGGIFDKVQKELNMDDVEDGDLVHLEDKLNPDLALLIVQYGWSAGAYEMVNSYIKKPKNEE